MYSYEGLDAIHHLEILPAAAHHTQQQHNALHYTQQSTLHSVTHTALSHDMIYDVYAYVVIHIIVMHCDG